MYCKFIFGVQLNNMEWNANVDVQGSTIWSQGLFGRGQLSRSYLVLETV